jgi:hypothetical protein
VIERDLQLGGSHPFVRRRKALDEEVAPRVVDVEHHVPVAIVLTYILAERVQRFGDVSGSGEYG